MTKIESESLNTLTKKIDLLVIKLFGNGTRKGCIDERLENVEGYMDEMKGVFPTLVTTAQCKSNHEMKWSKTALIVGLIATWVSLILKVLEVI